MPDAVTAAAIAAPAAVQACSPSGQPGPPPAAEPKPKPKPAGKLLLVDDEPSVLSALRRLFRLNGHATEQATSGADGLRILGEQPIDLVISDMRMPEMDGAAFLEQVRQRHPDCVRIVLTGYSDIGATVAAINRGEIHRYIAKPWDDQDLLLVVDDALSRRALERQNAELLALTQQQNQQLQQLNDTLEQRVAARTAELEQLNGLLMQACDEVNATFTMAVTVFSGLLEMRQQGIAGHARRVGELAKRMAAKLGLSEREQHDVLLAALLHDIGKIGFNDEMLGKPLSKYSADEVTRYQRHPLDGECALLPLDKLRGVAQVVRQHHERVDGRGFPDGLAGLEISLGAQIVSVASDYDGLVNGLMAVRHYSTEQARAAVRDGIGTHYALRVAQALFEVLNELGADAVAELALPVEALLPRMVLARDLQSRQGAILLPKGYRFDAPVIQKITDLATRTGLKLQVHVLASSVPAAATGGMHRPGALPP